MSKPSQVIVLVEDKRQQQIVGRFLREAGLKIHDIRFNPAPAGQGSGEQWVRNSYPAQVAAYRRRQSHAETHFIIAIDADIKTIQARRQQLDVGLQAAGLSPVTANEKIAHLIPKRNIETWILCLDGQNVNEAADYKTSRSDWTTLIRQSALVLYQWTSGGVQVANNCVASLRVGVQELTRLNL